MMGAGVRFFKSKCTAKALTTVANLTAQTVAVVVIGETMAPSKGESVSAPVNKIMDNQQTPGSFTR